MLVYTGFGNKPLLFSDPHEIISCSRLYEIPYAFERMEAMLDRGFFLAGFFSYEAGYGFEARLKDSKDYSFPLVYIGCYKASFPAHDFLKTARKSFSISRVHFSQSLQDYRHTVENIRNHISSGDVYQITYCMKMKFSLDGHARSLFGRLLAEQPVPCPAYIETGDYNILSLSPEMFMRRSGRTIHTKPMKGTWPRGRNVFSDVRARFRLKYDEKNRAENIMICDLLRNDLGRIGRDVRVDRLCEVTSFATLFQMTSSVRATVSPGIPLYELFHALFPSGSVTGAPKIRAMEIIHAIEPEERKIYTGAIGFIAPDRSLYFNVPIRTLLLSRGQGEMGIGGGIVWDSTPEGEWDESMLKAQFLLRHSS